MIDNRSGELLAVEHGFEDLAHLAESLPKDAHILDLGAADSTFGAEVALLRNDITWINFDLRYHEARFSQKRSDAPNLYYIAGDAVNLLESFDLESFDAVFSFWLFQYLSLYSDGPAEKAARSTLAAVKQGGLISIGPANHPIQPTSQRTLRQVKNNNTDVESFTNTIVQGTKLRGPARCLLRLALKCSQELK